MRTHHLTVVLAGIVVLAFAGCILTVMLFTGLPPTDASPQPKVSDIVTHMHKEAPPAPVPPNLALDPKP